MMAIFAVITRRVFLDRNQGQKVIGAEVWLVFCMTGGGRNTPARVQQMPAYREPASARAARC